MKLGTIIGLIGAVLLITGALCYWKLLELAVGFAGSGIAANVDRPAGLAMLLAGLGLGLLLLGTVISLFSKDASDGGSDR